MTDSAYLLELPDVGSIRVMRTNRRDHDGRRVFCYVIRSGGAILHRVDDLSGPLDRTGPSARDMTAALLSDIVSDASEPALSPRPRMFPADVHVWAQEHADVLSAAALRIERGEQ